MDFPWKEPATLVRVHAEHRDDTTAEILFEGPLLVLAKRVREMQPALRRNLRISLPDRQARPHTFKDDSLKALIDGIPLLG